MSQNFGSSSRARKGAVAVEFALVSTLFFFIVLSGVEFARVNMIRNSVENAAYLGARQGIVPGATAAECTAIIQEQLDLLQLTGTTIDIVPDPIESDTDEVTATITVPITTENGYATPRFYLGRSITASVTLERERPF